MQKELITQVASRYGIAAVSVSDVQKGYRNQSWHFTDANGKDYNLIIYKQESEILKRIQAANGVSAFLFAKGLPVRSPLDRRISVIRSASGIQYAALYNYLPGHTIPWEAYTKEHIKLLGASLSNMHAALSMMPQGNLPSVAEEYAAILQRMRAYFSDADVRRAMSDKLHLSIPSGQLDACEHLLSTCTLMSGQQPLHMDFVRSNILYASASGRLTVSGILDFEKAAWGHPHFDIARTLAFLRVDCKYKTPQKIAKYFLRSGYQKRGAMVYTRVKVVSSKGEVYLLQELMHLFLMYDFYKFLRHNPYEDLAVNEHYMRTRAILLDAGFLSVV